MFLNTDFEIYGSSHADDGGGDGDCDDVFDDGRGDDDDGNDDDDDADIDDDHGDDDRRLGVKTGAERMSPTGNPSPAPIAHATTRHDTTDQWREILLLWPKFWTVVVSCRSPTSRCAFVTRLMKYQRFCQKV